MWNLAYYFYMKTQSVYFHICIIVLLTLTVIIQTKVEYSLENVVLTFLYGAWKVWGTSLMKCGNKV